MTTAQPHRRQPTSTDDAYEALLERRRRVRAETGHFVRVLPWHKITRDIHVDLPCRTQTITVVYCAYPGSEYVLVKGLTGIERAIRSAHVCSLLDAVFADLAQEHAWCATVHRLVGGSFAKKAFCEVAPGERLYRDVGH